MNICFLARPCYDRISVEFYKCLNKNTQQINGIFITTNKKETAYIKSQLPDVRVYETAEYIEKNWNRYSVEHLGKFEKAYECAPIWSYIYTDRFLIERDYDYAVKMTCGLFDFFEYVYSENKIDFYYSETIATLLCYVGHIVGKKFGVQYVSQMSARGLDSSHHYFLDDPFQSNVRLPKDYFDTEYTEAEYERADQFLKEFETKDIRPSYMIKNGAVPKLKLQYIKLPVRRFLGSFMEEYTNPYSYINYQQHKTFTDPIAFYFRYQKAKKYYNKPDYTKKYVYFPLHYQPEASTIVCAAKYEKQLYYIDSWAKSLPADTVLYVKEHYAILGHRDLGFYEALKKYPNVILVDPYESPRKMIENAYAVTTLTGTAGWEAMLLRKPVFIGGNIFFDNAPGVVKVTDIYQNYQKNIENWKKPDRRETLQYLCAYFNSLSEGDLSKIWEMENPDPENIEKVSSALYEYCMETLSGK